MLASDTATEGGDMHGTSDAATHDEYLERLEEPRRGDVRALHELVRAAAPGLEPTMEFGILGYGRYEYRYASGRSGAAALVSVSNNKNYISLYVCAVRPDGRYLAETYQEALPKASIGKACIRFKRLADLDSAVLTRLLGEAADLGAPA
jgi:hypothetical protein